MIFYILMSIILFIFLILKTNRMVTKEQFDSAIEAINQSTNESAEQVERIASDLEVLKEKVQRSGISSTDEALILQSLTSMGERAAALSAGLKSIGAEPPVLDPLPEPPAE